MEQPKGHLSVSELGFLLDSYKMTDYRDPPGDTSHTVLFLKAKQRLICGSQNIFVSFSDLKHYPAQRLWPLT